CSRLVQIHSASSETLRWRRQRMTSAAAVWPHAPAPSGGRDGLSGVRCRIWVLRSAALCPGAGYISGSRFLRFSHAREFFRWFTGETLRARSGGWEARALLGLCDRYFLLTEIIGRADMLWHGDPGESVPAGNAWLYERSRGVNFFTPS